MRYFPLLAAILALPALAAEPVVRDWTIDGVQRQATLYVPPTANKTDTPMVFVFHGHGGNMRNAARSFPIHTLWPEALVVCMQGLPTPGAITDPQGQRNGWQAKPGDQGDRDLKFFDAVLATLKKDYKVDAKRVYSTGHSNGGAFTYQLWATRGDVFAAVAPSAAVYRDVQALKPKPVLHIAGENDPLVKFAWQRAMIEAVKKLDGCEGTGKEWVKSADLTATIYESKTGTPVVTVIFPGNHVVPRAAPELVVKFFKEHPAK